MLVALEIVAMSLSADQKGVGFAAVDAQRYHLIKNAYFYPE